MLLLACRSQRLLGQCRDGKTLDKPHTIELPCLLFKSADQTSPVQMLQLFGRHTRFNLGFCLDNGFAIASLFIDLWARLRDFSASGIKQSGRETTKSTSRCSLSVYNATNFD